MSVIDLKNVGTLHLQTYVVVNYFYYLHMRNSSSGMLRRVVVVKAGVPPKCWFLQEPHGVISQKMAFFIVTYLPQDKYLESTHFFNLLEFNYSVRLNSVIDD
jgi:hypothetical protein